MSKLEYTLSSVNKSIAYEIPNRLYNSEEVVKIIKSVLCCLDHSLREKDNGQEHN